MLPPNTSNTANNPRHHSSVTTTPPVHDQDTESRLSEEASLRLQDQDAALRLHDLDPRLAVIIGYPSGLGQLSDASLSLLASMASPIMLLQIQSLLNSYAAIPSPRKHTPKMPGVGGGGGGGSSNSADGCTTIVVRSHTASQRSRLWQVIIHCCRALFNHRDGTDIGKLLRRVHEFYLARVLLNVHTAIPNDLWIEVARKVNTTPQHIRRAFENGKRHMAATNSHVGLVPFLPLRKAHSFGTIQSFTHLSLPQLRMAGGLLTVHDNGTSSLCALGQDLLRSVVHGVPLSERLQGLRASIECFREMTVGGYEEVLRPWTTGARCDKPCLADPVSEV